MSLYCVLTLSSCLGASLESHRHPGLGGGRAEKPLLGSSGRLWQCVSVFEDYRLAEGRCLPGRAPRFLQGHEGGNKVGKCLGRRAWLHIESAVRCKIHCRVLVQEPGFVFDLVGDDGVVPFALAPAFVLYVGLPVQAGVHPILREHPLIANLVFNRSFSLFKLPSFAHPMLKIPGQRASMAGEQLKAGLCILAGNNGFKFFVSFNVPGHCLFYWVLKVCPKFQVLAFSLFFGLYYSITCSMSKGLKI